LNLGLRYDLNGFSGLVITDGQLLLYLPEPATGLQEKNIYEGSAGSRVVMYSANHTDFAPRFNFAWSPSALRKTVIRGGYDIFYTTRLRVLTHGQSVVNGAAGASAEVGTKVSIHNALLSRTL